MTITTREFDTQVVAHKRDAVREIYAASVTNGGGTFRLDGEPVTSGVAVGVRTIDTRPTLTTYHLFDSLGFIEQAGVRGNCLGTWFDEENNVWEVQETAVFDDLDDALALARALGERYVYDITRDECIAAS